MKLLVTGAAGFIGSHYVRSVLTAGYDGTEVTGLTVLHKSRRPG